MYSFKKDSTNLKYIALLEKMDTASLEYSTYCLSHAMQNGFYSPKKQSDEMKMIYAKFRKDTLIQYASQMGYQAPQGFWKNEHYTTIDLTNSVKNVISKKVKLYGFYGKEDGLYSTAQVATIENLLGKENVLYLDNCSHNVFIDQQSIFIHKLKEWIQ
jgi:proline iminopeptidase